jgi:hypothetical protein
MREAVPQPKERSTMQAQVVGWIPGTPYARATVRATDLQHITQALLEYGTGIDHTRTSFTRTSARRQLQS